MTEKQSANDQPSCAETDCDRDSSFWAYDAETQGWEPTCRYHAQDRHPSLEIGAWLESGYLKPIELGEPSGPPEQPASQRAVRFRAEIKQLMEWGE